MACLQKANDIIETLATVVSLIPQGGAAQPVLMMAQQLLNSAQVYHLQICEEGSPLITHISKLATASQS